MIATIGKVLYLESYKLRFINRYKLSLLGSHVSNCHIEGGGIFRLTIYTWEITCLFLLDQHFFRLLLKL